jgi:hypothetical protein
VLVASGTTCGLNLLGFLLVAQCLLPIDKSSLVYGSCDGGQTIHNSQPKLGIDKIYIFVFTFIDKIMDKIGGKLNLLKHSIKGKPNVEIVGPGDIEGHLGSDGSPSFFVFFFFSPPLFCLIIRQILSP